MNKKKEKCVICGKEVSKGFRDINTGLYACIKDTFAGKFRN